MAGKSVTFNTQYTLSASYLECITKWLSCNGEVWGVGPTVVFASAAALFLYNELETTILIAGNHVHVSLLEKTLISTMVLGMLALMIHLWVCSMRFFQYYLDTLIRDSPNVLLEMTTAGLLGSKTSEIVPFGPMTKFLRQQQPQIHITVCWFLSLCYADYVRKNYCQRFNLPYLEQWQTELHQRATRSVHRVMEKINSFVGSFHQRLRGYGQHNPPSSDEIHTVGAVLQNVRQQVLADLPVKHPWVGPGALRTTRARAKSCACRSSANRARRLLMPSRSSDLISRRQDVHVAVHRSPASVMMAVPLLNKRSTEDRPWRRMVTLPFKNKLNKNY